MPAPIHDWYFKEWMRHFGKRQADVVRDLEWNKAKASLMWSGKQPYNRADVNEISAYLNLRPYELLMHPDDAMALRSLRAEALRVVKQTQQLEQADEEATGTFG